MFKVLEPGPYTTVQDRGRYGYQQFGVPPTGAVDDFAYRVANLLVGNPSGSAVLEMTVMGSRLEVMAEADMAVTGAEVPIAVNDESREGWSSFRVKCGDVVRLGHVKRGCRAYLAVTGGIDVPPVMDSRSTYVGGRIGGFQGRPLRRGDVLPRGEGPCLAAELSLPKRLIPRHPSRILLRAVPGPQEDFFDEGLVTFFDSEFKVTPNANRMGYRLQGPVIPLAQGRPKSIISEPNVPGGVQIPADGQPIILLVEQTVGGYAKIATVISVDIPLVAQAKPGDRIRFQKVDLAAAHAAFRKQEETFGRIAARLKRSR